MLTYTKHQSERNSIVTQIIIQIKMKYFYCVLELVGSKSPYLCILNLKTTATRLTEL